MKVRECVVKVRECAHVIHRRHGAHTGAVRRCARVLPRTRGMSAQHGWRGDWQEPTTRGHTGTCMCVTTGVLACQVEVQPLRYECCTCIDTLVRATLVAATIRCCNPSKWRSMLRRPKRLCCVCVAAQACPQTQATTPQERRRARSNLRSWLQTSRAAAHKAVDAA